MPIHKTGRAPTPAVPDKVPGEGGREREREGKRERESGERRVHNVKEPQQKQSTAT